jgi:hypothetical protein
LEKLRVAKLIRKLAVPLHIIRFITVFTTA